MIINWFPIILYIIKIDNTSSSEIKYYNKLRKTMEKKTFLSTIYN